MNRELFGTDGIRGVAGQYPLNEEGITKIGRAVGTHFGNPGDIMLLAGDPRQSSPEIMDWMKSALAEVGIRVKVVGTLPTPGLAYLTQATRASAGVMITASHNPYTDNGVKVFGPDGGKLHDSVEAELNALIDQTLSNRPGGGAEDASDLIVKYEDFLVGTAGGASFEGQKIALDTANGATSKLAERVLRRLGFDTVALFDEPNGTNINLACGATDTLALQAAVTGGELPMGLAFDGDGDRLMLIDSRGKRLDGDHMLYILAKSNAVNGVVTTLMSNLGLINKLHGLGIDVMITDVGDRYVLEGLEHTGYTIGTEKSGHVILSEYSPTGDGLLAAIQVLKAVQKSGMTLADWFEELVLLPQKLVNITVSDKNLLQDDTIQAYITAENEKLKGVGRLNVRPSGTEPKVRIMVEAPGAVDRADVIAQELTDLFKKLGG